MAEFILFSIVIIWLFCYYYPQKAKKTFLWLFIILPIFIALYTFAPIFLAVSLAVFMLIGSVGAVFNSRYHKVQRTAQI
ncbi:MAG: hypothetical protein SPH77_03860 [Campylobacter sp.]|uniref:hypothetical protein n=1 Tax=Campylobacter sp. TaxID=205 RepID=UPI002A8FC8D7|nr:hypothetical protein [Campylobacter sp.]MCI6564399.1 hypothetical protein [Campylobacter sp.]MCI6579553.1 hypothetical protein [Campylobacter sp.]MCI7015197.1 hypothetical protein [Campylobacter sp.]MDY3664420.1 hypothetical protein [Campylobacter sp.]MDY6187947.1 hypothetical protein [Campylobacter sp.]